MIRVIIADDHPVVREGVCGMLATEPDIDVCGEAGSGEEVIALALARPCDVVLMDLRMPGMDGVAAIKKILAERPGTRIVVLTTYETDADILRAVEAGAIGYLLKDTSRAALADAIRMASRGETVLAPSVAARLVAGVRRPQREPLSQREVEVLRLVARGHDQRRDRARPVHQRGDGQNTSAAGVRQTGRGGPDGGGHRCHRTG